MLADIKAEREAQDRMWGVQEFPDGSGPEFTEDADRAKHECATAYQRGELTWRHILAEEFCHLLGRERPSLEAR